MGMMNKYGIASGKYTTRRQTLAVRVWQTEEEKMNYGLIDAAREVLAAFEDSQLTEEQSVAMMRLYVQVKECEEE
jgi:hypothetical protein